MLKYYKKNLKVKNKNNRSILIFLSFFLLTQLVWCQEKINHIKYSIELKKSKDNNQSHYNGLISNLESKLKQITFDLNYNSSICKFSMNTNSLSEEDNSVILDITDMLGREYYSKVNCDTVYVKNEKVKSLKDYTCFSIDRTEWMVTYEKKIINGYECTKALATLEKDYGDGKKIKVYDIVAWFCPKIANSFGPKSYGGLQGIIMELEQPIIIFKAVSLDYSTELIDLSIPTKNSISESHLFETINRN
jgi:GLPGLI family protein